ncbi:carbonic anhydrase [Halobacillus karajensis]|uniref:carbonic anhydrase n=1 Tax=Halobacillus karajensis TaxID=195088 RepID=A0A024P8D4_9BACI|nr:carbonic anhydrase family protein [Halobacillus karajensis]CDQ20152.1 Carbonic anhydrase precursor [Halobacillus karajensis]CDQ25185.1 Carbonic anhydrase precursor [Halobacillus karajensis]CDQ28454.1 Carbonic anhydrase precursor [Halobacillus karajensis]SEI01363.1 carbonic anhydrase [Halobacillus karajensis]
MMRTKLGYTCVVLSFSFLLGACSEKTKETSQTNHREAEKSEHSDDDQWSYKGETGPGHWGELDPANKTCADGSEQSPINIEFSQLKADEQIKNIHIQYEPTPFSILNNGHTVLANPSTDSNHMVVEGHKYQLAQFHFHTPSEHQFNGVHFDMELHLVHKDANGEIAVLGVMIKEGKENEEFASIWGELPDEETSEERQLKGKIDLEAILPQNQTSLHYSGSLTTPPCTEDVKWVIFKQPIEMSKDQIQAFQQIFPDNHRPVHPLNDRTVKEVQE